MLGLFLLKRQLERQVTPLERAFENREAVIQAAFADDEGFRVVGEELLRPVLIVVRRDGYPLGALVEPTVGPRGRRVPITFRVGDRRRLGARDLDRLQDRLFEAVRRALRIHDVRIDDREQATCEVYRIGNEHGWRFEIPTMPRYT